MKQFILFLLTLIAPAMGAAAQNTVQEDSMFVCQKSGKVVGYAVSKVDSIVYEMPGKPVPIDLGLSVKWANINVGASRPDDNGEYYAWGETDAKLSYTKDKYHYYKDGSYQSIGEDIGGTQYDVARVKYGADWRMPTATEFQELYSKCTWTWTTQNTAVGYKVTAPNGNSIFLPAAGSYVAENHYYSNTHGLYWSSNNRTSDPALARNLYFYSGGGYYMSDNSRKNGLSVRAVYTGSETSSQSDTMYVCYKNAIVSQLAISDVDSIVFEKPTPEPKVPDWAMPVDLGLSVKWANMNIGAQTVNEIGSYYSWGEIEEKDCYDKSHYQYYSDGTYQDLGEDIAGTQYDVAHAKWGGEWRMPTIDEMNELLTKCTWMWTTSPSMNDIHGYRVTGPNGETLFFPAVGCYSGTSVTNKDVAAYFWTSACNTDNQYAHALCLYETMRWVSRVGRQTGVVVRAVCP